MPIPPLSRWHGPGRWAGARLTPTTLAAVTLIWAAAPAAAQSLRGRVVDGQTDVPVTNARVALVDSAGTVLAEVLSDDGGLFVLDRVPGGEHRLLVEAFGYQAVADRRIRRAELPLFLEVRVDPEPVGADGIAVTVRARASHWRNKTQFITGKVLDARTGDPIEAMDVLVRDVRDEPVGRTLSDEDGRFGLAVDQPGLYRVAVARFGYDSTATATLAVAPDQNLYVELQVQPAALGLDPIRVTAPRVLPFLESTGFYARQRRGHGHFFGPGDLERIPGAFPSHILRRVPGISVTRGRIRMRGVTGFMGQDCSPKIILDWMQVRGMRLDDIVRAYEIDAIEVYKGPATVPPQWRDAATCGVIAVWTKH